MFDSSILLSLVAIPLIGIIILFFIPDTNSDLQKNVGLSTSLLTFLLSYELYYLTYITFLFLLSLSFYHELGLYWVTISIHYGKN